MMNIDEKGNMYSILCPNKQIIFIIMFIYMYIYIYICIFIGHQGDQYGNFFRFYRYRYIISQTCHGGVGAVVVQNLFLWAHEC